MSTGIAVAILVAGASVAGIAQATLSKLEAETRAQCAAAAWPARQAAAHRDFCRVYGYPTP
jgi:hypothetical protein